MNNLQVQLHLATQKVPLPPGVTFHMRVAQQENVSSSELHFPTVRRNEETLQLTEGRWFGQCEWSQNQCKQSCPCIWSNSISLEVNLASTAVQQELCRFSSECHTLGRPRFHKVIFRIKDFAKTTRVVSVALSLRSRLPHPPESLGDELPSGELERLQRVKEEIALLRPTN